VEASRDERAGDRGSHNGISVVEGRVEEGFAVGVTLITGSVAFGEHGGPVEAGGLSFVVIGIARPNCLCESVEGEGGGCVDFVSLSDNLCLNDGFPSLFPGGLGTCELGHEPRDKLGVSDGGEEKTRREMAVVTDDDDGS